MREERRKKWLQKLIAEFLKLEPLFPEPKLLPDGDYPAWLEKVEREFGNAMFPVARIKEGFDPTPKRLGAFLGHACANGVWLIEQLDDSAEEEATTNGHSTLSDEQLAKGIAFYQQINEVWYPALRRLAKRALCSAVDQCYEDMTAFLKGYSDAFSRKPKSAGLGNLGNSATEIYFVMFFFWRRVDALRSVRDLHRFLIQILGCPRVGDLKRVEKICQRIGLRYRKPGRPKKAK